MIQSRLTPGLAGVFFAAALTVARAQITPENQENNMPPPKVIIFDVNETLLSLDPLKESVGEALGNREDLLPLWFSTMLHYSLVETLSDSYHSFGEIGTAALMMVAETQGIEMTVDEAREAIIPPLRSLPPHPDVPEGLEALKQDGRFKLVTLTNSNDAGARTKLTKAGLVDQFDTLYTIEALRKYKPHPDAYRMVLDDLGLQPEDVLMVAAHAWDLAGADNVGLQTAFIARPGKTLYPNAARPDYVVNDLSELASIFLETTLTQGDLDE
ncbi:haloacid dehalogenase type II [Pontiella agarivorans]|uniref:Haloacid dehalogenase type II n=1 Tax=Pontiella agarivorans TaxID=3038953 RepID=A0ABU5MZ52_9BACT|nr:haloacid dehalogenase type II [Pontiella agarivorans]MDZ8119484.1 haloacid dehalogenase type II [Pontiella agarivorans]